MRFFVTPVVFLATVSAANFTVGNSGISPNGTRALQILSFLDKLQISILDKLVAQTNNTAVREASEQEKASVFAIDHILRSSGAGSIPQCNCSLPNSTSSLISLEQAIHVIRTGTALGSIEYLQYSDPFLLPTLVTIAIVQSLRGTYSGLAVSQISGHATIITPITPEWAFNLVNPLMAPDSCAVQPPLPKTPKLEISSRNGSTIGFTWDPISRGSRNGTLYIGWVNWPYEPIYTPVTLTSYNSGTVSLPRGLWGYVVAVLTEEMPDNMYDLTAVTISGPAMAEIVF